jgi:hypothetical protein
MQTLGISNSTPPQENRFKNLFWPTIRTGTDVDALGTQGFWICAAVGFLSLVSATITGQPIVGIFTMLYFYMGGVGVREHNLYAAIVVFIMQLANTLLAPGVLNVFLTIVLLSNMRATFIASFWEPEKVEAEMPIRFNETWGDKFADKWPAWLWPKIQIVYYIYSATFLLLVLFGLTVVTLHRLGIPLPLPHPHAH